MPDEPAPSICPDCGGELIQWQAAEATLFDGAWGAPRVTRWRVCKSCSYDKTEVNP